jgi:hypothetical protein
MAKSAVSTATLLSARCARSTGGVSAGYPETATLSEVLLQLNETSLSQLRRDHETKHLEHKIAKCIGINTAACRTETEREGAKMNQVNARHEIIREWRSLPKELRQTDEQAAAFAMQIKDKYKFSSDSADHYQTVKDWLLRYLSITRGLEPNAEVEGRMKGDAKSTDPRPLGYRTENSQKPRAKRSDRGA